MNFKTCIIAGHGTIGSSLFLLGKEVLDTFEQLVVVDRYAEKLKPQPGFNVIQRCGNIEEPEFLQSLFREVRLPTLFVNLSSDVDNVRIRKIMAPLEVAYIDSCSSSIYGVSEFRFSKLMPYSLQETGSRYPHWLCWGINPGMVEIISRKMMREFFKKEPTVDVSIFEFDQFRADFNDSKLGVAWSPAALIEEIMISPSFWISNGKHMETQGPGTHKVVAFWDGQPVDSRLVGHEDIWNIGKIAGVNSAVFYYALDRRVMEVFDGDADHALEILNVPDPDIPVYGLEQVAVQVKGSNSGNTKTLAWILDHEETWRNHNVNAVQFQTGKSLLLAISLLQHTHYGRLPLNCCAADLPIDDQDWENIEQFMESLNIHWVAADNLALHTAPTAGCVQAHV